MSSTTATPPPVTRACPRSPAAGPVLVVGGGPAGMECARVLAERGHRVRLAERGPELGGMLVTAALVHGRQRLGLAVDWWHRELQRLGVSVTLGHEVSAPEMDSELAGGACVVLATGSVPGPRDYRIAPGARVLEAADLLARVSSGGPRPVAGRAGCGVRPGRGPGRGRCRRAARRERPASVDGHPGPDRRHPAGPHRRPGARPTHGCSGRACPASCAASSARWPATMCCSRTVWTGEQRTVDCAFVVHCGHRLPEQDLYLHRPGTLRAGDCVAPRTVLEAVLEARRVALSIGIAGDQAAPPAGRALSMTGSAGERGRPVPAPVLAPAGRPGGGPPTGSCSPPT